MKIILILLITLGLYAETFKEYKDAVGKDIVAFDKKYGYVLYNKSNPEIYNEFHKANGKILIRTIMIDNYFELDLITMAYLDYKLKVQKQLETKLRVFNLIQKLKEIEKERKNGKEK